MELSPQLWIAEPRWAMWWKRIFFMSLCTIQCEKIHWKSVVGALSRANLLVVLQKHDCWMRITLLSLCLRYFPTLFLFDLSELVLENSWEFRQKCEVRFWRWITEWLVTVVEWEHSNATQCCYSINNYLSHFSLSHTTAHWLAQDMTDGGFPRGELQTGWTKI